MLKAACMKEPGIRWSPASLTQFTFCRDSYFLPCRGTPLTAFVHSSQPISATSLSRRFVCRCSPRECAGLSLARVSLLHLPWLFCRGSFLSSNNNPSIKVLGSVFFIKSQEYLQLDKSHISGPAWYVSYCVIGKELNYLFHEFGNISAV